MKRNQEGTRIIVSCMLAYTGAYICRLNFSAALPAVAEAMRLTGARSGLPITLFALVYAAGQLISGALTDRVQPRHQILTGLLLTAAVNLALTAVSGYGGLVMLWTLNGLPQAMLWTPIVRLISERFDARGQRRASFLLSGTIVAGHLIAWTLAGTVARRLNWRCSFLLPGCVTLLIASAVFFMQRDIQCPGRAHRASDGAQSKALPLRAFWLGNGMPLVLLCCLCDGFVREGVLNWTPTILAQADGGNGALLMPLLSLLGLAMGSLALRVCRGSVRGASAFVLICCLPPALALLLPMPPAVRALLLGCLYAAIYSNTPMLTTLLPGEYASCGRVGLCAGVTDCAIYIGASLSGTAVGALRDGGGWGRVYLVWAGVLMAGAALCACSELARRRAARAHAAQE